MKAITIAIALLVAAGACATEPDADLVFEDGAGGKEDASARPYGLFRRTLPRGGDGGMTLLQLNENRTFIAYFTYPGCPYTECPTSLGGTYRFASAHGKPYVVLYDDAAIAYSFEYKLEGHTLWLRDTTGETWLDLPRAYAEGLTIGEGQHGQSFDVPAGAAVTVKLAADPGAGYSWRVAATDSAFGLPVSSYQPDSSGGAGTMTFTWATTGASVVGTHYVKLAYGRTAEMPTKIFELTVRVIAPN